MIYKDRFEAGQKLASELKKHDLKNAIIFGLPRGGALVALEVANILNLPLDLIIVKKVGHPENPEYAICTITENGFLACNEEEMFDFDQEWLKKQLEEKQDEAKDRRKLYEPYLKKVNAKNKVAIIVDDGVATGLTVRAAIKDLKSRKPQKIIVAVPVAPIEFIGEIKNKVDNLIVLEIPEYFLGAVAAYYESFPPVIDEEIINLLRGKNG